MDVEKTKVESLDIIVTMMEDKPYYGINTKRSAVIIFVSGIAHIA